MKRAAIGLGANLGERLSVLTGAVRSLHCPESGIRVSAISHWYETEPVGPPQPPYINGCLLVETELPPGALLTRLQALENQAGRDRTVHWGARTLDLDLLWYDDCVLSGPGLTLPHPHLAERAFVLVPLEEIAPEWLHPLTGLDVTRMRSCCPALGVERWPGQVLVATKVGPVELRPLVPADFSLLRSLAERCWWATYRGLLSDEYIATFVQHAYCPEMLLRALDCAGSRFWVAEVLGNSGQELVGFTQVLIEKGVAHLVRLYVAPERQGLGIGTALWQLVLEELTTLGVSQCSLTVLTTNTPAIRFYERQGFVRVGPSPGERYEYRIRLAA